MYKRFLALLACALLCTPAWGQGEVFDFFTGTLEIRNDRPVLVHCDIAQHTYLLVDKDGASHSILEQFQALGIPEKSIYHATIIGAVFMESEQIFMRVKSIENIHPTSCHLLDFFPFD